MLASLGLLEQPCCVCVASSLFVQLSQQRSRSSVGPLGKARGCFTPLRPPQLWSLKGRLPYLPPVASRRTRTSSSTPTRATLTTAPTRCWCAPSSDCWLSAQWVMALLACMHTTALKCSMLVASCVSSCSSVPAHALCCPGMPLRKPHFTSGRPSLTLCYAPPLHLPVLQVYAPSRTVVVYAPAEYCDSQASPAFCSLNISGLCRVWPPCLCGNACVLCLPACPCLTRPT